jgi:methylamine dehydrogenase heavy chain
MGITHRLTIRRRLGAALVALLASATVAAQEWDSVVGAVGEVGAPTPHWFSMRGRYIAYLIDGDAGEVKGTLTLSMFSPAVRPHLAKNRIYSYGSFYTRTFYGDRTDLVMVYDATTTNPVAEIEIPPKSAGIGHSGMIGLIDDRFVGVWNITPAMSVSIVDVNDEEFVGEISTPGCAAVYPVYRGFLMPCGDGTIQYITLKQDGTEDTRVRSESFFSVEEDPVFDYAVPTADGWLFLSLDGLVFEATVSDGEVSVSEPWSILAGEEEGSEWRIGGRQPFAYNAENGLLVTLMHEGGGQETFEDAGTEVWGFNVATQRRGYRQVLAEEEPASGVQLTEDADPLLIITPEETRDLRIHRGVTGRQIRVIEDIGGGLVQNL